MKGLIGALKKKPSLFQKNQAISQNQKPEEESKNEIPKKTEEIKENEQPKKGEQKEEKKEEKKEDINANKDKGKSPKHRQSVKDKTVDIFKNMLKTTKNESTLKEIYNSLETARNFEMSALKNPPKLEEPKGLLSIVLQKQPVNYPLSAIGLLKCDYGKGLTMFGTGTLINLNMVITCAHVLYSPILKRRCESATFYLNLSEGKYLDESEYNSWTQSYEDIKYKAINDKSLYPQLDLMIE